MKPQDPLLIRSATPADGAPVASIYNPYVTGSIVTFEEEPASATEMSRRIDDVLAMSLPWLVAERDGDVLGFAYATKWRPRFGYRFSVEVTVYLAVDQGGRGIGSSLYESLIAGLRERRLHAALGGIALPNDASVALHEKFGFKKVAHFTQVGIKFDRWIDVGYWQLLL